MYIRQENDQDFHKVYAVVKAAFETAEHSDGKEQDLVTALRKSSAFIPELSLVAEMEGEVAGHIMFTEAKVGNDTVLVLAPEHQRKGVGSALLLEGHRIARELGYSYSLVLGSEKYYPRFGYLPANQFGIDVPDGIPAVNFMAMPLQENTKPLCGAVAYAREFGI